MPVENINDFDVQLKQLKKEFHQARHICWAYRIHGQQIIENSTDAGEPGGTAGIHLLNALRQYEAMQTMLFVVRYFGGVKLGKQGLTAAYTQCADKLCHHTQWQPWIKYATYSLKADFSFAGIIENWMRKNKGQLIQDRSESILKWYIKVPESTSLAALEKYNLEIKEEADTTKPRR